MAYESVGGGPDRLFNPAASLDTSRISHSEPEEEGSFDWFYNQGGFDPSDPRLPVYGLSGEGGGQGEYDAQMDAMIQDLIAASIPQAPPSSGGGSSVSETSAPARPPSLKMFLPKWARDMKLLERDQFSRNQDGSISADSAGLVYWGEGTKTTKKKVPVSGEIDWVGGAARPPDVDGTRVIKKKKPATEAMSIEGAANQVYTWESEEVLEAMDRLRNLGYGVESFEDLEGLWQNAVVRAAQTFMATEGERKVTPWDILEMGATEMGLSPLDPRDTNADGQFGPGDAGYNGKQVTTQKSITELSEGQAWSVLQSTVSQLLGRDPSDGEVRDFTHRMGRLAASNPSISRTVTQFKDGEATGSTTRTKAGFTGEDAAKAAYDRAQSDPDYAEYQSATTYFNALQSALGPIGSV